MDIILFINIICTGIVLSSSLIIFSFGIKINTTRIHAIFWFVIFLYLFFLNLESLNLINKFILSRYIHFFIPVFYSLYILISISRKFYPAYLLLFLIPIISFPFATNKIYAIFYHLIFWSVLIFLQWYYSKFEKRNIKFDKKEIKKMNFISTILTLLAVFPFIITNLVLSIFSGGKIIIESILPPCLALVSLSLIIISYKTSLIELDHNYYTNIDFLKKSIANEKKSIIEKISAGLVHEIKNPLTSILSLNQQLIEYNKNMNKNKINEYLNIMQYEIIKTKKLTDSFLKSFKKENNEIKEVINLYEFFYTIIELVRYELNKNNISLKINPNLKKIQVLFNPYKLREVLLNLIFNSIEANSKNINISCANKDNFLNIFIKDDGNGISNRVQQKLFTPFFTTKTYGCGMGLFLSREIMHDNLGNLELISSKNKETVFCISIKK